MAAVFIGKTSLTASVSRDSSALSTSPPQWTRSVHPASSDVAHPAERRVGGPKQEVLKQEVAQTVSRRLAEVGLSVVAVFVKAESNLRFLDKRHLGETLQTGCAVL